MNTFSNTFHKYFLKELLLFLRVTWERAARMRRVGKRGRFLVVNLADLIRLGVHVTGSQSLIRRESLVPMSKRQAEAAFMPSEVFSD